MPLLCKTAVLETDIGARVPLTFEQDAGAALQEENSKLTADLREAREKIRNLELQVESMKANARKAAEALMNQ